MQSNRIEPAVMLCYVVISVQALFKTFINWNLWPKSSEIAIDI